MTQINQLELYDIYELWHVPFWQRGWFRLASGMCIVALLVLVAWMLYHRLLKKRPKPIPAWQEALEQLKKLQDGTYQTKQEGKQFYFTITEILKKYIAARFLLDAESKTDEELAQFLHKQQLIPLVKEHMQEIALGSVYIKFADEQAMQEQIERHLAMGIELVTHTIPE